MFRQVGLPVILLSTILAVGACTSDNAPDARIPLPGTDLPDAPAVSTPDASAVVVPDAPVAAPDAPAVGVDAPPIILAPDAAAPGPDAAANAPDAPAAGSLAKLIINEVSPNINVGSVDSTKHDLVELLVTGAGTTEGLQLLLNPTATTPTVLATFPAVEVAAGDLIVVHLLPATPPTAVAETTAKDECKAAAGGTACPDNYDGAWDFIGNKAEIGYSARVLAITTTTGALTEAATYQDAVPFYRSGVTPGTTFLEDVKLVIAKGLWSATCPNSCAAVADAGSVAVSWGTGTTTVLGTDKTGATVQRKPAGVNEHKASDWQTVPATKPNTLGAAN